MVRNYSKCDIFSDAFTMLQVGQLKEWFVFNYSSFIDHLLIWMSYYIIMS